MFASHLTITEKHSILDYLWKVLDTNTDCLVSRKYGLCYNIKYDNDIHTPGYVITEYFQSLYENWSEFSGHLDYPVKCPTADKTYGWDMSEQTRAGWKYTNCEDKWVGEYGEARIRLVMFLIQEISKDLGIL